jgi:error-prone DNA polymerase
MGLSVKAHPVSFVREKLSLLHITPAKDLAKLSDGSDVKVAGLVLVRQRPGTASGICFITLEDEGGISNSVVFQKLFDKYRKQILSAKLLMIEGKLQKEGEVIHVIAKRCYDISKLLADLTEPYNNLITIQTTKADEKDGDLQSPQQKQDALKKKVIQADIFHGGRNFK